MSTKKFKVWYKRPVLTRKQERRLKKLIEEAYGHVAGKRKAILTNTTGGLLQKNQKTHISIPFTPLSKYISEIMHRNHYKREVVIALLRELGVEGERPVETFLYGGCWHGEDPERGDLLFEEKADYAFFSDITGSSRVEYSKRLFYNEVISMGTYLFHTGNLKSLQYNHGSREIRSMKLKLKRGFNKLMRWQSELENKSYKSNDDEIIEKIRIFVDKDHPRYIKNHGEWMVTFSKGARKKILAMIKEDTIAFINILGRLRKRGTRVIVVEGNWDSDHTMAILKRGSVSKSEQIIDNFSTREYLRKLHFEFYNQIEGIDTLISYHILIPFYFLLNMEVLLKDKKEQEKVGNLLEKSRSAKKDGKTVVFYAHGVPYPEKHNSLKFQVVSDDNKIVARNLRQLMSIFRPEEVIYPHFHSPLVNKIDYAKGKKGDFTKIDFVPFREVAIKKIFRTFNLY